MICILHVRFFAGSCSTKDDMTQIHEAILSNAPTSIFINLCDKSGTTLSSHIHIQPLKNRDGPRTSNSGVYAVITIRSASNIGNSIYNGRGILGTNPVRLETLKCFD